MSQVEDVIRIARAEVGYHEGKKNGNWNNNQKYSKQVPGLGWSDYQPWCATFVSWVAMEAKVANLFPRTASTDAGASWFKGRKRWSAYPAIGAQVFYGRRGDMNHTGIVYDFDGTYIYTIEGNTNQSGSYQGDGVYLQKRRRTDDYVQGYGYPQYAAGIVSADPAWRDARPSKPVVKPSQPVVAGLPAKAMNPSAYFIGAHGAHVKWLGKRLVAHGFNKHHDGDGYQPGPTFTEYDRENVQDFQLAQGWHGTNRGGDADGLPGSETLKRLRSAPKKKPSPTPTPKPTPVSDGIIDGADISHWQDQSMNFKKAKAAGVKFVIHKCTEALNYEDPKYGGRRKPVTDAGIVWGAYHFARPSKSNGDAQARYFLLRAKFKDGDMRPVLDLEDRGGLGESMLVRWVQEFSDTVQKIIGVTPILYTNFDLTGLSRDCPLWVARYNNAMKPPNTPSPWKRWDIWQFSNGTFGKPNSIPGMGHVDINTMNSGVKLEDLRIPKGM